MSNHHPKFLLKMNNSFHHILTLFVNVVHPAAGRSAAEKKKKRTSTMLSYQKGTPDSLNMRHLFKNEDSIRRNPAP
jgi:hypothetical protein